MEGASPEFLPSNAVRPQIVVLDAFCGIKNTQKSISAGALPRTPYGGAYTALPYPIAGGDRNWFFAVFDLSPLILCLNFILYLYL